MDQGEALAATELEDLTGGELLLHVGALADQQRRAEVGLLRAAAQHAVINDAETVSRRWDPPGGGEQALRLGGDGTPKVAEFSPAELGTRAGLSPYAGRQLIADALDLRHRLPQLWKRVELLEVRVSYARYVARETRALTREQALHVNARVVEAADGRVSWSRFEDVVAAAVIAADPQGAREREEEEAGRQYANRTRRERHGMRGFHVRAHGAVITQLETTVVRLAEMLRQLGDQDPVNERRVKAVLVMCRPDRAAELLAAYAVTRRSSPEAPGAAGGRDGRAEEGPGDAAPPRWADLLPTVRVYIHLYGGLAADAVARFEGQGPVTEEWVRRRLGERARFEIQPVLDLAGQAPVDAYEIPDRHREAVRTMTPADTFPFASCVSREQQVDHTVAYVDDGTPGQSRIGNYGPMTTAHHRVKTHGGWQVAQPFPGIYVWRDPHGGFYLVDWTGTRPLGVEQRGRDPG